MQAGPFETPDGGADGGPHRVLLFRVGGRDLAMPIGAVLEIIGHRGATEVPRADPAVEGILPFRGRMLTIVDLRPRLGLPPRAAGSKAQVIVIESSGDLLGLVVDLVRRVGDWPVEAEMVDPEHLLEGIS